MNAPTPQPLPDADPLIEGVTFYQVLTPAAVRDANGQVQYAMHGPYTNLAAASQHCQKHPRSVIMLNVVVFKNQSYGLTPPQNPPTK